MVPKRMQRAVWAHYEPGQEITKSPSRDYLRVTKNAIDYVAECEGR